MTMPNTSRFRPDHERQKAIDRSREDMRVPPEIDTPALAAQAVRAYWEGRKERHLEGAVELETALASRSLAARLISPAVQFVTDALAVAAPVLLVLAGVLLLLQVPAWMASSRFQLSKWIAADRGIAAAVVTSAFRLEVGLVLAVVSVLAVALLVMLARGNREFWRNSGGALAAGMLVAAGVGAYSWYNAWHEARTVTAALMLSQERLGQLVAASFDTRRATGAFPGVQAQPGPLSVKTSIKTPDRAVYIAVAEGVPGKLVADLGPDRGAVYWQYGNKRDLTAKLFVGTVSSVREGEIVLTDPKGQLNILKTPQGWALPRPGDQVVVLVEPKSQTAASLHFLAASR